MNAVHAGATHGLWRLAAVQAVLPFRADKVVRLMDSRQRPERGRLEVARAILDAARDLFVSEGYEHVSIRKIAERVEYSPAAIYRYFSSKDDIFFALAEEGFRRLAEQAVAAANTGDALDAVRRAFWGYYEFSKAHPEYFALMFLDRSVPRISRDWERFSFVRDLRSALSKRLRECVDAGVFPAGTDPEAVFSVLATSIHGASVIRLCSRLSAGEDADALARDTLEAAIAGLRGGSPITMPVLTRCPVVHEDNATGPSSISRRAS